MNTRVHKTKIRKIIPAIFIGLFCLCPQKNVSKTFPKVELEINDGIGISMTFDRDIENKHKKGKEPVTGDKTTTKRQNIVAIKIGKANIFCLYGEKIEKISISIFKQLIIRANKKNG